MITIGIVSNSALCFPVLHYLKAQQEHVVVLSAEKVASPNGSIGSFCANAAISCTDANGSEAALYDWAALHKPAIVFIIGYHFKIHTEKFTTGLPLLFNVHMGDLPGFRGPNPVFWQLKKGSPLLAITIHCVSDRFDAGDVAWKKEYRNEPFFNYGYVYQLMSHYLVEGVGYLLQKKKQGQPVSLWAQNEQQAGYFGQPTAKDVCIEWEQMTVAEICDLIKACNPWNGGAITSYNGFEVRINDAEPLPLNNPGNHDIPTQAPNAGVILTTTNEFLVSCLQNKVLKVHSLTVNGAVLPGRFAVHYGFTKGQSFKNI